MQLEQLNILLLANEFPPEKKGGVRRVLYDLSIHLRARRLVVLAPSVDLAPAFDGQAHCTIYRTNLAFGRTLVGRILNRLFGHVITFTLKTFLPIVSIMIKERIDLLLCGHIYFGLSALIVKKIFGRRYILLAHGLEITRPRMYLRGYKKKIYESVLHNADLIICPSEYTRQQVLQWGVPEKRIKRIPWGVDWGKFANEPDLTAIREQYQLNGKKVLLTVGALRQRKGQDTVIQALPLIIQAVPHVQYLIVGEGENEISLRKLVNDLCLENHVEFVGYVPDEELSKFYHVSDVFVMPCRVVEEWDAEGFGLVFLEANACGKPIVAGRSGGAVDIVEEGANGLTIDGDEVNDLAEIIIRLLLDEENRIQMGGRGKDKVWQRYRWDQFHQEFESILNTLE